MYALHVYDDRQLSGYLRVRDGAVARHIVDLLDEPGRIVWMDEIEEEAAMKPICVPCQRFFRVKKTGFYFIEGMPMGNDVAPGTAMPECWKPYKLWVGDLWACQGCGTQIVQGTGGARIAEHYEPDFSKRVAEHGADQFQVNDC